MSPHALRRQREMQISDAELARCLSDPENSYTTEHGRRMLQRGRVSALVSSDGVVVTVLWKTTKRYRRKDE